MYQENKEVANTYRNMLLNEINTKIRNMQNESYFKRKKFFENNSQEYLRGELTKMLGFPLTEYEYSVPESKEEFVSEDEYGKIYRLTVNCMDDVHSYGLLFLPNNFQKSNLILAFHGKEGTPEIASSFYNSCNYNDMVMRIRQKGVSVYIPQFLLWNKEYGNSPDNISLDLQLKQLGASLASFELFKLRKTLDYLMSKKCFSNVGAIGLSYGGFYTLLLTALDLRIKSAMSCCFFNDRLKYNWSDWVFFDSGNKFLDSELCGLICPRNLYIAIANNDQVFNAEYSKLYENIVKDYYKNNQGNFVFEIFDGEHEFPKDDKGINFVINTLIK